MSTPRCEGCDGGQLRPRTDPPGDGRLTCPSCTLYDAAVAAQRAAATSIAINFNWRAKGAWLNEHGVFAYIDGKATQVASPAEAKPFAKLTTAARAVQFSKNGDAVA